MKKKKAVNLNEKFVKFAFEIAKKNGASKEINKKRIKIFFLINVISMLHLYVKESSEIIICDSTEDWAEELTKQFLTQ